jgi:hypothetical protein
MVIRSAGAAFLCDSHVRMRGLTLTLSTARLQISLL